MLSELKEASIVTPIALSFMACVVKARCTLSVTLLSSTACPMVSTKGGLDMFAISTSQSVKE